MILLQGNEAVAKAAIAAGVRFFGGYPITPSTEIAESMAKLLPKNNGVFIQMEDEIASMGVVLGASLAGKKVLTASSGPGISLKQELIGYAAAAEIPVVIVNVQRVGPSTGQPTAPSQGDVMQARWGTHGDHSIIALSPWSVREAFDLTVKAVNYAERFRTPVILLMDEIVGHLRENVELPTDIEIYPRRQPKTKENYKAYAPDEDLVPNIANFGEGYHIHVTGLIHDETGFPVGSPKVTREFIDRMHKKISKDIIEVQTEFLDDAEEAVVAFGGTARTAYQAVLNARANGKKVGFIRLVTIWPFADNFFANLPNNIKKLVVAELNYGQIFYEVQRTFKGEVELCAKYDMTIFEPSEIEVCL